MPNQYSYSRISAYLKCPLSYKFYLQRRKDIPEPEILQTGALAHAVYEAYARHCENLKVETDITAIAEIAKDVYDTTRIKYLKDYRQYLGYEQYQAVLDDLVIPWANRTLFPVRPRGIEVELCINKAGMETGWFDRDAWFRAKCDLIEFPKSAEDPVEIIDYKTGWSTDPDPLQARIYAWMLFGLLPYDGVAVTFQFTRSGVEKGYSFDRCEQDRLDAEVRKLIAQIEADTELNPTPGAACQYCQYAGLCTAKAAAPDSIASIEDARETAAALALLDRDMKSAKERLRAWCVGNGPVEHGGTVWGFHAQGGPGFDDAKVFADACEVAGVDPWEYLSVNGTKVKRLRLKNDEGFRFPELDAVAVNKRSTVFAGRKAAGGDE